MNIIEYKSLKYHEQYLNNKNIKESIFIMNNNKI